MYKPKGWEVAREILTINDNYLVYYDPDIDGAVSGEFVLRLLDKYQKPYMTHINNNRQHGLKLTFEQISRLKGYTVILVDAGMTREEIKLLVDNGVSVINIDHHEIEESELVVEVNKEMKSAGVIINNQYPFEPDNMRFLSGAGMVYYTFNSIFPSVYGEEEQALVGLTLLSDIRSLDTDLAKQFLFKTYSYTSPYMDYLLRLTEPSMDFGFGERTFDRNFIDYTFSPKINALFRLNKGVEAVQVFRGTYTDKESLNVYRGVQNAIRDFVIDTLDGEEYSHLGVKYIESWRQPPYNYDVTNFVGLACSRLTGESGTTFMFVKDDKGNVLRGSVRGKCDDVNYLDIFRRHGFKAGGHGAAFGVISVDLEKVDFESLNTEIAKAEEGYEERKYMGRVIEVQDMNFFLQSRNKQIADYNNYVRDNQRIYLKYTGKKAKREERGKAFIFDLDGQKALAFDPEISIERDLVLPLIERGKYIQFYMKKY